MARSSLRIWLALLLGLLAFLAGCSSSRPWAALSSSNSHLSFPSCTTTAAPVPALSRARNDFVSVPGHPFAVVTTSDGRWSFVSLGDSVGLFSDRSFVPTLVRTIPTPGMSVDEALTPDGRHLIVADYGGGAAVVDVADAEAGRVAVVARLSDPRGGGAIEAAVSPDGHYVFITLETRRAMAVFDLRKALTQSGTVSSFVGEVLLPPAPVGLAISPDGRFIYAISEGGVGLRGLLSVIDLTRAETDLSSAVLTQVAAGCSPVRVITDGSTVWVTARGSNELLAFSAALLGQQPAKARIASVEVGSEPVGLTLVDHGRYIVVADSNRFGPRNSTADLRVVDVAAALAGRTATVSRLAAGGFPREMAVQPDGSRLLVTDYRSGQLQAIDVASLP